MNTLRFQRIGRSYAPYYRLVVLPSRSPQSSSAKAVLGVYHPKHGSTSALNMNATLKYIKLGSKFTSNSLRAVLQHMDKKSKSV